MKKIQKWIIRIFRFFIPKDFKDELIKGMYKGEELKRGKDIEKVVPTWWIGKGLRKIVDPKHKMKVGNKNEDKSRT